MLRYWPYAQKHTHTHTHTHIHTCHIVSKKPGILNTRFLFLQYKKNTQKINTHALPGYCSSELNFT